MNRMYGERGDLVKESVDEFMGLEKSKSAGKVAGWLAMPAQMSALVQVHAQSARRIPSSRNHRVFSSNLPLRHMKKYNQLYPLNF